MHRAGELGYATSYCNIGYAYSNGRGVVRDERKAIHYWEIAAMGGDETARHNLGCYEEENGRPTRAMRHYIIISAKQGHDPACWKR